MRFSCFRCSQHYCTVQIRAGNQTPTAGNPADELPEALARIYGAH